jgi:hypothetical protein
VFKNQQYVKKPTCPRPAPECDAALHYDGYMRWAQSRLARASIVLVLSLFYLSSIFQLTHDAFWQAGLGDWMDPYFINFLLEHWYHSVWNMTDPASPSMFFPVRGTLGYSHGLILYAPFYMAVRPFLHPFQAYGLTIFLVMETGITCLYSICRKFLGLSFIESLLLSAYFMTSLNVTSGFLGVWSQRASVFLIPPILLLLLVSLRMRPGRGRIILAGLSGLLSSLLFTQDFYTAQFALFFVMAGFVPAVLIDRKVSVITRITTFWKAEHTVAMRVAILTVVVAAVWMLCLWTFGGFRVQLLGVRISSQDWRRPAVLCLAGLAAFVWLRGGIRIRAALARVQPWALSLAGGGVIGSLVFFWIYLPAYREHPAFPAEHLTNSLVVRDPSRWHGAMEVLRDLRGYDSLRSFALVAMLAILAWVPWLRIDRKTRLLGLWFLFVSFVVLLVPLRLGDFSLWMAVFEPLPGFSVIRDPKRIIYLYELAVVLGAALFLTRLARGSLPRTAIVVSLLCLLAAEPNRLVFDFMRPNDTYDRWVAAPIAIDSSCQCFFIKQAAKEYRTRPNSTWTMYAMDAMFVSVNHSLPTLNGYSAWSPDGWTLANPDDQEYSEGVRRWIRRHNLSGVCELDIDRRTMTPYSY